MIAAERQAEILRRVQAERSVQVTALAEEFGVSEVTIRRDVGVLADSGLVTRVHGGAVLPDEVPRPTRERPHRAHVRSLTLGMVVPSVSYYYPEVIRGAQAAAEAMQARIVLGITGYDPREDRTQVEQLISSGVDGLLVTTSEPLATDPELVRWLASRPAPVVLVEREVPLGPQSAALEFARTDHAQGAFAAVAHLAALGHTRVALMVREASPTTPAVREGHRAACAALGLDPASPQVLTAAPTRSPRRLATQVDRLLAACRADGTRAVLVHPDQDAILLVQRLRAHGLAVPADMAVVAYDDEVAALADVPLTAVRPSKFDVGRAAVELLVARIRAGCARPARHVTLVPTLQVRASTGHQPD